MCSFSQPRPITQIAEEKNGIYLILLCTNFYYISTVKPKVQLYTSVLVARSGSSVNVICKADSYPPANSEDNYHMKHPRDHDINAILLSKKNGVVHVITNASKEMDSGEYECTVIVELDEYSTPLQSDNVLTNLTVYGKFQLCIRLTQTPLFSL